MRAAIIRSLDSGFDPRTISIARALQKFEMDLSLFDWSLNPHAEYVISYGRLRSHGMGFRSTFGYVTFNLWVLKGLIKRSPDLVVAIDAECFISVFFYSKIRLFQRRKLKIIFDIADSLPQKIVNSKGKKFAASFESICINFSDFLVYPSENRLPTTPKKKSRVIGNLFISKEEASSLFENKKVPGVIFYGGLLLKDRGLDKLLSLANKSQFTVVIVGYGALEEYVRLAADVNPKVKFCGKLPFHQLSQLRSQAQFSWCWYDQNSLGNIQHASGKIGESLLVGSVPITNINPQSLSIDTIKNGLNILYVTDTDFEDKLNYNHNFSFNVSENTDFATTEDGYLSMLGEIYG
jgi:hypothetical protein